MSHDHIYNLPCTPFRPDQGTNLSYSARASPRLDVSQRGRVQCDVAEVDLALFHERRRVSLILCYLVHSGGQFKIQLSVASLYTNSDFSLGFLININISPPLLASSRTSLSRAKHSCAVVAPGRVLVAGGVDEAGVVLGSVGVFDVANGTWHQMPDMIEVSSR